MLQCFPELKTIFISSDAGWQRGGWNESRVPLAAFGVALKSTTRQHRLLTQHHHLVILQLFPICGRLSEYASLFCVYSLSIVADSAATFWSENIWCIDR